MFNNLLAKSYRVVAPASIALFLAAWLIIEFDLLSPPPPPYPPSQLIKEITYDWNSHIRKARGSDNWPVTWADDNHQYSSWGDGGGFGGGNEVGRVSLGVARIEGGRDRYQGKNIWGGLNTENVARFEGKSYGIISVDGVLYMWVSPGSGVMGYEEARLYRSYDRGASWAASDWAFEKTDRLINPAFLQFGKDYDGALDDYVYSYASHLNGDDPLNLTILAPGEIALMRVPRSAIFEQDQYEYFNGFSVDGDALWSSELRDRMPVFRDKNGVGWNVSVSYNKGLGRYLLMTEHSESLAGRIGIYEAPSPWGPWSTIYYGIFGSGDVEQSAFYYNFSNKWLSGDGRNFVMIFTGIGENDSWNSVAGEFELFENAESEMLSPSLIN
ncbi:MAG: DUF4185 domain-containing protein [Gammaproteobacteria bacterium]|nr:DUF4185 domain-containing protein [Gammaproteobacteria bacterium]